MYRNRSDLTLDRRTMDEMNLSLFSDLRMNYDFCKEEKCIKIWRAFPASAWYPSLWPVQTVMIVDDSR